MNDEVNDETGKKWRIKKPRRDPANFPWRVATFVLLFVSCGLIYYLNTVGQNRQDDIEAQWETISGLQREVRDLENANAKFSDQLDVLTSPHFDRIMLSGKSGDTGTHAWIYRNRKTKEVFLDPTALPPPEEGNQYQLWSEVEGNVESLGTVLTGDIGFQQMENASGDGLFFITIEPVGGSAEPTMDQTVVQNKNS